MKIASAQEKDIDYKSYSRTFSEKLLKSEKKKEEAFMVVPTPFYVLRGHSSSVTAVAFDKKNHLFSGDENGFVICWSLLDMRPLQAWYAHSKNILGMEVIDNDILCTQSRDCRLSVWKINFDRITSSLPLSELSRRQSQENALSQMNSYNSNDLITIYSSIHINALTFCSFSYDKYAKVLAVSNTVNVDEIDIYEARDLLSENTNQDSYGTRLQNKIRPTTNNEKTGALMCTSLISSGEHLLLAAGYESGHVAQFQCNLSNARNVCLNYQDVWEMSYFEKSHSQPVLSVKYNKLANALYSSSADDRIVLHSTLINHSLQSEPKVTRSKHCGQQCLQVRQDDQIIATAGWDGRSRIYSCKSLLPLAVLKYHSSTINSLSFYSNSNIIALASKDSRISLWKIY
ncbi:astra associated protein 1 A [Schizosaccharomyces cryophilus OY26]|uniref:ASTRA-associated protein 1 n=1 Tax=Schizosaccharomyces cryophilus (strain OY26 / ATCC MYA-4695 / CBS 11777 / NBRC 106824 / NRRL Y48691) TaxID=653667 RepID=S9X8U4_SCHCR|nr:astra associated protein 1 A [Schizosaccharomyces cryophilus OY26]EPY50256.1 astra associated protein 1 A [Schizosaccharomyces cryophilus OY26]